MSKIEQTQWGIAPNQNDIKSDLLKLTGEPINIRGIHHIRKGFTDNVFKISTHKDIYILKEFTETWHLREAEIYKKVLSKDVLLRAPTFLGVVENRMYLQYYKPSEYKKFQIKHVPVLFTWILYKHDHYSRNVTPTLIESEEVRHHYLVEKPLNTFKTALFKKNSITEITNTDIIQNITLLQTAIDQLFNEKSDFFTLEHGDLEPQNLLYNPIKDVLGIVDWTNSKFADGLTDFNQFLEDCHRLGINTMSYQNEFLKKSNIKDCERKLRRNRFFMLLNKLNYYLGKLDSEIFVSESSGENIPKIVDSFLSELDDLAKEVL